MVTHFGASNCTPSITSRYTHSISSDEDRRSHLNIYYYEDIRVSGLIDKFLEHAYERYFRRKKRLNLQIFPYKNEE